MPISIRCNCFFLHLSIAAVATLEFSILRENIQQGSDCMAY